MGIRKRHIWAALFCIYIVMVAYLCFMSPDNVPEVRPDLWGIPIDKVAHFTMFAPYPIVAYGTFRPSDRKTAAHLPILLGIFLTGSALAAATEYVQGFSEYRSSDINDFYADMTGIAVSTILLLICLLTVRKTQRTGR